MTEILIECASCAKSYKEEYLHTVCVDCCMPIVRNKWISVKDELPGDDDGQVFLAAFYARGSMNPNELGVRELCFNRDIQEWFTEDFKVSEVQWEITHWMPLPLPPEIQK